MKIDDISDKIETQIDNAQNVNDLKDVMRQMVDENIILRKQLNIILGNLDSENVKEIDFRYTRYPKASTTILKGYATIEWVAANFAPKV